MNMENSKYNQIINAIRQKAIDVLPKGSQITLFGSRARGDAHENSDWDLHILVPGPEKLSFRQTRDYGYPFEEMGWELNQEINTIVHSYSGWKKRWFLPLYQNIIREGIKL